MKKKKPTPPSARKNKLSFISLQEAWEEINLMLAESNEAILENGGGVHGTEFIAYDCLIKSNTSKIDPDFNFGKVLGYTDKKWTSLVKNYIDFDYLDLVKSEITVRSYRIPSLCGQQIYLSQISSLLPFPNLSNGQAWRTFLR